MKVNVPNNIEWKNQREKRWENELEEGYWVDSKEKEDVLENLKTWYVEGDLTPLMTGPDNLNRQSALSLISVMSLCPIMEVDKYVQFFQDYSFWLSEQELNYWGSDKHDRDNRFISPFFRRYLSDNSDSTKEIYEHMLKMFLPDDNGVITFPFKLGKDEWQPQLKVALCTCAFDVFNKLGRYLYGDEEEHKIHNHIPVALPIVRFINDLDFQYFSTKLITTKPKRPAPPPTPRRVSGAGQEILRERLGNLYGYSSSAKEELRHNDLELEKQLRDLIDSLSMPEEFYPLIDFIKEHPDNYLEYSE